MSDREVERNAGKMGRPPQVPGVRPESKLDSPPPGRLGGPPPPYVFLGKQTHNRH